MPRLFSGLTKIGWSIPFCFIESASSSISVELKLFLGWNFPGTIKWVGTFNWVEESFGKRVIFLIFFDDSPGSIFLDGLPALFTIEANS